MFIEFTKLIAELDVAFVCSAQLKFWHVNLGG